MAKVIPIFKSDDERDPNNYRPISLLSCFNRIFEKLVWLNSSQCGFRHGHSTEHAIFDIVMALNQIWMLASSRVVSLLTFDTVDHGILLQKLAHHGFRA